RKEHAVQPGAGVVLHAKPGMQVRGGQPLITLHTDTPEQFGRAHEALATAYEIGDSAPEEQPLIIGRVT
ncbi:MAG TPA: thymidine phosphorylase, partial [Propionibacteriaceae bacterium]|nr:thymidine phosphorylase [Propionibacteriaceae bacterium]